MNPESWTHLLVGGITQFARGILHLLVCQAHHPASLVLSTKYDDAATRVGKGYQLLGYLLLSSELQLVLNRRRFAKTAKFYKFLFRHIQ